MVRLAYSSTADDDPNVLKDLKKLNMWEPLHSVLSSKMSPLLAKVQVLALHCKITHRPRMLYVSSL
jgi:hypothetical protein